jgi:hypothetical protein
MMVRPQIQAPVGLGEADQGRGGHQEGDQGQGYGPRRPQDRST